MKRAVRPTLFRGPLKGCTHFKISKIYDILMTTERRIKRRKRPIEQEPFYVDNSIFKRIMKTHESILESRNAIARFLLVK